MGEAQKEAARCRAADNGEEGPHLQQAVADRELFVGQQLGQNAVLRRAEERAVDTHAPQDDQGGPSARWIHPERDGPGSHQRDLAHLYGHDDGSLAQPVREHTGHQGKQHEREVEHDEGDGGLCLGGGFKGRPRRADGSRDLPDGQQGDHQFPRVVVERAEELRDQQAADGMFLFLWHATNAEIRCECPTKYGASPGKGQRELCVRGMR